MAQVGHGQLANGPVIVRETDGLVEDLGPSVRSRDVVEFDPSLRRSGHVVHVSEHLVGASPDGDTLHASLVKPVEVGRGGELGVEEQFLWHLAGTLLPIVDKLENLVMLLLLAELPIGVAENPGIGIVGQQCQDTLVAAAPFGDIMLLHQGVVAMKGNGVEVEVKRGPLLQTSCSHGIMPQTHEREGAGGVDAARVLGEKGTLGHDIEPGKERETFVEDVAHDMAVTRMTKEFQGEQRPHGLCRRNLARARQPGLVKKFIEGYSCQRGHKQKQSTEFGPEGVCLEYVSEPVTRGISIK